jgi:serine/threonine-protein kinase
MEYAHNMGVVHCDIKPQNIMVTDQFVVKLADFGTASMITKDDDTLNSARGTY